MFRSLGGLVICLAVAGILGSCSDHANAPYQSVPIDDPMGSLSPQQQQALNSSNAFGFTLFHTLDSQTEPSKNIFISPLSVSYAFGMTYNGASGGTREAIARTLGIDGMSQTDVNSSYRSLTHLLCDLDTSVTFDIANAIWYRLGFPVKPSFIELNREFFNALVKELDFSLPTASDTINGWVSDNTNGLIRQVIDPPIDPGVVMILANAIYFKGAWTIPFDTTQTRDWSFTQYDGSTTNCRMMVTDTTFAYTENDLLKAIEIPYGDKNFAMGVLQPVNGVTLDQVIGVFSLDYWQTLRQGLVPQRVTLRFPRLKFGYNTKLNDVLVAMGMGIAFDPTRADFSGISDVVRLYISKALHKSFIQVDEEGTEAAAVTVIIIEVTGMPRPDVTLDRPFLFVIYERTSGAILFMGKVMTPTWED